MGIEKRGFASMNPVRQREIASEGGKAAHALRRAPQFTTEQAREAGRKGGERVSRDAAHMAEIGRRGGHAVASVPGHMAKIGRLGGAAVQAKRSTP